MCICCCGLPLPSISNPTRLPPDACRGVLPHWGGCDRKAIQRMPRAPCGGAGPSKRRLLKRTPV